jgi:hypothetical protein
MKSPLQRITAVVACVLALAVLTACETQEQQRRTLVEHFQQMTAGEWRNESGARLFVAPVRARMVSDEAIYVERHAANGDVFARLIAIEGSADGKKVLQRALTFTQEGQWRNLREAPEMFTALLPKDVRGAGTCDISVTDDANELSYSCSGSPPEKFNRVQLQ